MDLNKNNEIINMMLEIEYISSIDSEKINNQQYNKFPISECFRSWIFRII